MRRLRKIIPVLLLGIALLAAVAWIASYFRWPASGSFPWPSTGLEQTHDAGFVVLANGRLFIVRQRIALAPSGTGSMPKLVDRAPSRADGTYLSADSRQLGTLKVTINTWKGPATTESSGLMSLGPLQPSLTRMPWKRLGFASQPLGTPRIALPGVMITAPWTATAIPLWPFVLLGVPAAWLLMRGHQSRRWMEQGRCGACGYDLRESPERCPECGAAVAGADFPGTLGNARRAINRERTEHDMSKQVLEAAFERRAAVDASDRLSRPWAVVLAGWMVSIAVAVLVLAKSPDNGFAGALLTAFAGCFLTLVYVVVGRRYSKELAQRWTGAAGLLVALAGVAYLYYEMLWKPYP